MHWEERQAHMTCTIPATCVHLEDQVSGNWEKSETTVDSPMNVFRWGLKEGPRAVCHFSPHKRKKLYLEIRDKTRLTGVLKNLFAPYAGESYRDRMWDWYAVCVLPFIRQVWNADREKRRKRWESKWSGFTEFSQLFPLSGHLSHCKDQVSIFLSQSPEKWFICIAYIPQWGFYCRLKLTSQINKCLKKANQNKRSNFMTSVIFSFISSILCSV